MGTFVRQHPIWTVVLVLFLLFVLSLLWLGVGLDAGGGDGGVTGRNKLA
jgi:hypothetical protein